MPKKKEININNSNDLNTQEEIDKLSYEQANNRLEEITNILNIENQDNNKTPLSLGEMCKLYEEGQALLKHCESLLNNAQQNIEIATENGLITYK